MAPTPWQVETEQERSVDNKYKTEQRSALTSWGAETEEGRGKQEANRTKSTHILESRDSEQTVIGTNKGGTHKLMSRTDQERSADRE